MLGVDTNILVRLLARDDESQFARCEDLLRQAGAENPLVVNPIVIAETIWVLEGNYGIERLRARQVIRNLLDTIEFSVLEKISLSPWSGWFMPLHRGVFDLLIAEINKQNGCDFTYTFDKNASENVPGMELLA